MKFDIHKFWINERSPNVFFYAERIKDYSGDIILEGAWCNQEASGWRRSHRDSVVILPSDYDRWREYQPFGEEML